VSSVEVVVSSGAGSVVVGAVDVVGCRLCGYCWLSR